MGFRLFGFDFGRSVESSFKDLGREMGSAMEGQGAENPPARPLSPSDNFQSTAASHPAAPSHPPILSRAKEFFFGSKSSKLN